MHCARCQEVLSARLDGESSPLEDQAADRHVARCGPCAAFAASLGRLAAPTSAAGATTPSGSIDDAPPDDLTVRVLDRLAWSPDTHAPAWARYGLLVVALTEIALALPQLIARGSGLLAHDQHHLGAWDLAFGVGLLVVAWQPERARGLLPLTAALGVGMVLTALADISGGRTPAIGEAHHLLELAGVVLLWVVGRAFRLHPRRRWRPRRGPTDAAPVALVQSSENQVRT